MPRLAAISRTASAPQAFRGDASSRNEKSGNLASCLLVGEVLFRPLAIRHGVSPGHRGRDTPGSQKAPSTIRCIKTTNDFAFATKFASSQKAPSTKRCIKTQYNFVLTLTEVALSESTERPKISHAIHLVHTSTISENRRISTFQFRILKNSQPNCVRHFPTTLKYKHHKVH